MEKFIYNKLNSYYNKIYGERTLKICIDGGFTCPNRDGKVGTGGCIFCSSRGSGDQLAPLPIKTQITNYLNSYKKDRANKFIVYFQNFTSTYDTPENLKKKYFDCLISDKIVGISIATRPDCICKENVAVLKSLQEKTDVYVELGLQTANDNIGKTINRCYKTQDFITAVKLLNEANIKVIVHIMVGLPNETQKDILDTISLINSLPIHGIKIHSTYVLKNTKLNEMYTKNLYTPITMENYICNCGLIIQNLRPDIVVHRITADAPRTELIAPEWNLHKKVVLNNMTKYFIENDIYQGKNYKVKPLTPIDN